MSEVRFDASEFEALSRAFQRLPGDIKAKAFSRAMNRMREMARTRIVDRGAKRVDISKKNVREITTAYFNAGSSTIEIIERSGWIALYKLGATRTRVGVNVKLRGSYEQAFIAAMKSGHKGVFKRQAGTSMPSNPKKEQIKELFGPNPAHDVTNNPEEYLAILAELIQEKLLPRMVHELDRILPR